MSGDQAYQAGFVSKAQDYRFGTMSVNFATIESGETSAQRTVVFRVRTHVTDKTVNRSIGDNLPFEVISLHDDYKNPDHRKHWKFMRITNSEKIDDPTRARGGDIFWYDTITHKYYAREELVSRRFFISKWKPGVDLKSQIEKWAEGVQSFKDESLLPSLPEGVQMLKIYLNPWDEKYGTFGTDARVTSQEFLKKVLEREKIPSRLFIGEFKYQTLRFRYNIDEDMKLLVKKTVLLDINPFVLRYSSILDGIISIYSLRDGIFLFKNCFTKRLFRSCSSRRI